MKKRCVAALLLMLAGAASSIAGEKNAPAAHDQTGGREMNRMIRSESKQPMDMNAPMPTGMAKKGMKKGDVKAHAAKKEAVMDRMLRHEETGK